MTNVSLVEVCWKILDESSSDLTPEHLIDKLDLITNLTKSDKKFLSEILYGSFDNKKVLNVVVDGYYLKNGKNCSINERNLYFVISYILIFQVKNYGISEIEILKSCSNLEKVYKFLRYFLNEKNLLTWIKDAWHSHFEIEYVENQLLNPILSILPDLNIFIKDIENKIYNFSKKSKSTINTTTEPFNLTQPSRKKLLLPEPILVPPKRDHKPKLFHVQTDSNLVLKKTNSIKDLSKSQNKLLNRKSKSASNQNIDKIEKRNDYSNSFKAKPFNIVQNEDEPIKLNTAVVLKDEYLIKKQADELIKKFAYLEFGEGNADEFLKWQNKMKLNDLKQKQEQVELKKLQSKLAYEEAILAKNKLTETNKKKVFEHQKETEKLMNQVNEIKKEEALKKNIIVKLIQDEEEKVKLSKLEVEQHKKAIAKQIVKENERLEQLALRQVEEEMKKKIELIQQIKAAESLPVNKMKLVDLTSTAGHRLLSEMSIVELKERLELLRQENGELNKKKHDNIIKKKMEKDQILVEKLHYINKYRTELGTNEYKKEENNEIEKEIENIKENNPTIQKLKKKIIEAKEERLLSNSRSNQKLDSDAANQQYKFYQKQRKLFEQNRFKDLEKTQERYVLLD